MILVAAHSASGRAAIKALPNLLDRILDGSFGLDHLDWIHLLLVDAVTVKIMKIKNIPSLDWGFS